jgi:predicted Zn finger-like uncharacterized protein
MADDKYTRCPGCATVFRVADEQLRKREGQVRCGHCKAVFDALVNRIELGAVPAPAAASETATQVDTAEAPAALQTPGSEPPDAALVAPPASEATAAASAQAEPEVAYEDRFAPAVRRPSRRTRIAWYAAATTFLLLLLALQAVLHFRDAIAAHWPTARAVVDRLCSVTGCAVRPLRDPLMSYLSIESSDLQADPAHRGLLILTASVRNHAPWPLAYPYLELTLTDAQDRIVVRRALAPADYAGGTANLNAGIAANAEVALKVFIDASATNQAGYRLYMFYP